MFRNRNTSQYWIQLATTASLVILGTACGVGETSGPIGQNAIAPDSPLPAPAATSTVTLAWEAADGPIAGYAVFVSEGGGPFDRQTNVAAPRATVEGDPGEQARIVVAAFDAEGNLGPGSNPSAPFTFPGEAPQSAAAALLTAHTSTRSLAAPADDLETNENSAEEESESALDLGELAGGLVWTADGALRVTNADLQTHLVMPTPQDAELMAAADFDGDGAPDLLWSKQGILSYASLADGADAPAVDFGELANGESLEAVGDFDGDGKVDLLLRDASGSLYSWLTVSDLPSETLGLSGDAVIRGVGDFDGDGRDDLAWRAADGSLSLWLIDAARVHSIVDVPLEAGLDVTGVGDFDGDGSAELAIRDASGSLFIHEPLSNQRHAAGSAVGTWNTVGATDLNGDGSEDLVLEGQESLILAALPGEVSVALDPTSPWELVALLP